MKNFSRGILSSEFNRSTALRVTLRHIERSRNVIASNLTFILNTLS
jgi:hypothetical protein